MANINLSDQDIDYIARVVDTEVPHQFARSRPDVYAAMVQAVVDTIVNRVASEGYPNSVEAVSDQRRQFSKITGPSYLDPYGSVKDTPKARPSVFSMVKDHITARANGKPSSIGAHVNYANPFASSKNNLGWINAMAALPGSQTLGIGKAVHIHGTAPGAKQPGSFVVSAPGAIGNPSQMNAKNIGFSISPNSLAIPSLGVDGVNAFGNRPVPAFAPADRPNGLPGDVKQSIASERPNLGADRIAKAAYSEYGKSRVSAPQQPVSIAPVAVPNVHSNFDAAGKYKSLPADKMQLAPAKPASVPVPQDMKNAYAQYAASRMVAEEPAPKVQLAPPVAAKTVPKYVQPVAPKATQPVPRTTPQSITDDAKKRAAAYIAANLPPGVKTAALPNKSMAGKIAGSLIGSLMGGLPGGIVGGLLGERVNLGGVLGGIGQNTGSNYTGGWAPAAGGNMVSTSPIGVGLGGEPLSGVTNQFGATSMLGEGGSRTYGGPGGDAGK